MSVSLPANYPWGSSTNCNKGNRVQGHLPNSNMMGFTVNAHLFPPNGHPLKWSQTTPKVIKNHFTMLSKVHYITKYHFWPFSSKTIFGQFKNLHQKYDLRDANRGASECGASLKLCTWFSNVQPNSPILDSYFTFFRVFPTSKWLYFFLLPILRPCYFKQNLPPAKKLSTCPSSWHLSGQTNKQTHSQTKIINYMLPAQYSNKI